MDTLKLTLLSALGKYKTYQNALQDGHSVARYMNIPLMSDVLAEKISYLSSEVRPHILESGGEDCVNCISWVDVIREGPLRAEKHNEKYRFRVQNRREVFEMTQFDFNLILSGLPRKLVHPETHTSDILAEISAIDLLASEMRAWKSASAEGK
jgi:hypothetical protein